MSLDHPHADEFIAHIRATQQQYVERSLSGYLAGIAEEYASVQLHAKFHEDKAQLAAKMAADMERFELLSMDLELLRRWFAGATGFAHLRYVTRLRLRADGRILLDKRENIIVGRHMGDGRWTVTGKIVVRAENHYE